MKRRALNLLIALDQFLFVLVTLGHASPDETLSAAAYRWEVKGKWQGRLLRPLIDGLFFLEEHHCFSAYVSEWNRKQYPDEYQIRKETAWTKK